MKKIIKIIFKRQLSVIRQTSIPNISTGIAYNLLFFFTYQRSFKRELFETAASKLERAVIKCQSEIAQFRSIGNKAFNVQQANQKKEEDYSDAPDHFMGEFL